MSYFQIHTATENGSNAIPIGQAVYAQPVVAQQGMQKVVGVFCSGGKLGTG